MKLNYYHKLSLNVMALFLIVIFASLIPDSNHEFFGDWVCKGNKTIIDKSGFYGYLTIGCDYGPDPKNHSPTIHWGYRHWLWLCMGLSLFVIQIFRIGNIKNK